MKLLIFIFFLVFSGFSHAGMIDKEGMYPWEVCALCHSLNGISPMAKFPKLAGQKRAYIEKQFWDFHKERRTNDGGQMWAITTEVEAGSVQAIADYFSNLPPSPAVDIEELEASADVFKLGKQVFERGTAKTPACGSCHAVEDSDAPWLFAQHGDYLLKQLEDFKEGERGNDTDNIMWQIAQGLSEGEREAVVFYLEASQPRVGIR